ncbi:hypothetical protein SLUN_27875 [Streptomyces lunaelactis]|uniref:Uncharacterized protein n=2 Tax=Streptomyces lunaelactis TaxID=1535768 RepID=A0A2R4T8J4_9ACTN|nr:hypothetical protein [Streptomyces lunaelactis]AVZ75455.1 hypothetical protein SLUN_27875 [Streptomyces lunaelactis]NUK82888.1 hypothetical protein [Streptomyces lunaelactis]
MRRMNPSETKETTDATGTAEATVAKDKATAETVEPTEAARTVSAADESAVADEAEAEQDHDADDEDAEEAPRASSGIGAAAAAVVAAGLGVVALSGSWVGKVAAERQTLIGQIETSQTGSPAQQISALYGDAWHTTALVNGVFALLALIVGAAVFAWPQKAGWVRAFAVAGVVLGVLGLIVSAGMYFDFFLDLPSAGAGTGS